MVYAQKEIKRKGKIKMQNVYVVRIQMAQLTGFSVNIKAKSAEEAVKEAIKVTHLTVKDIQPLTDGQAYLPCALVMRMDAPPQSKPRVYALIV